MEHTLPNGLLHKHLPTLALSPHPQTLQLLTFCDSLTNDTSFTCSPVQKQDETQENSTVFEMESNTFKNFQSRGIEQDNVK